MTLDAPPPAGPVAVALSRGRNVLRLEVVERNGDDFILEGRVTVRQFSAIAACDASLDDLNAWRKQLAQMHEELVGRAHLEQTGFAVTMEADSQGRVILNGMFDSDTGWGDGERAILRFSLPPLDQTDLPPVVAMLDAAMTMSQRDEESCCG